MSKPHKTIFTLNDTWDRGTTTHRGKTVREIIAEGDYGISYLRYLMNEAAAKGKPCPFSQEVLHAIDAVPHKLNGGPGNGIPASKGVDVTPGKVAGFLPRSHNVCVYKDGGLWFTKNVSQEEAAQVMLQLTGGHA